MSKYGFCLAQSKGFNPNYGYVKTEFNGDEPLEAQRSLLPGEVLWYVDGEAFTYVDALEMADEKAQELFGKDPAWLDDVLAQQIRMPHHNER